MKKQLLLAAIATACSLCVSAESGGVGDFYRGAHFDAATATPATSIEEGKTYLIYDAKSDADRHCFRYVDGLTIKGDNAKTPSDYVGKLDPRYLWTASKNEDGNVAFFNEWANAYIPAVGRGSCPQMSESPSYFIVSDSDQADCFSLKNSGDNFYWNGNDNYDGSGFTFAGWTDAHPYQFFELAEEDGVSFCLINQNWAYEGDHVRFVSRQYKNKTLTLKAADDGSRLTLLENGLKDSSTEFVRYENADGSFCLYSPFNQKFVGSVSNAAQPVPMGKPASAQSFSMVHNIITMSDAIRNSNSQNGSGSFINAYGSSTNGNVGGWYNADNEVQIGSHWFTVLVGHEDDYTANIAKYNDLRNAILNLQKTPAKVGTLLCNDASYYHCNYPASSSAEPESSLSHLLDDDVTTYFHSDWGSYKNTPYHDLAILIPDNQDVMAFTVQYSSRFVDYSGQLHQQPGEIWVYGSTTATADNASDWDGIVWETEPFAQLTGEADGLGLDNGLFSFEAEKIYKALRFEVRKVNNENHRDKDTYFFTYGRFKLFADVKDVDSDYKDNAADVIADYVGGINFSTGDCGAVLAVLDEAKQLILNENEFDAKLSEAKALYAACGGEEIVADVPGYYSLDAMTALGGLIAAVESAQADNDKAAAIANFNKLSAILPNYNANLGQATYNTTGLFTISNTESGRGALIYKEANPDAIWTSKKGVTTTVDKTNPNHLWGFVEKDGKYYLYNAGAKKFVNSYKPFSGAGKADFSWGFSNVASEVSLLGVQGYAIGIVSIRGGENSKVPARPGMMIINNNAYPVPCVAGSGSATDGAGFRFEYAGEAGELVAEMQAALEAGFAAVDRAKADADLDNEANENIVGHYDAVTVEAIANAQNADKIDYLMNGGASYNELVPEHVYSIANEESILAVLYEGDDVKVARHSFVAIPAAEEQNQLHRWICMEGTQEGTYSFYHICEPDATGVSLMSFDENKDLKFTIDGATEFPVTRAALGKMTIGGLDGTYTITHHSDNVADATTTAISEIVADGAEGAARWYTIQGVRVAAPAAAGVYVRVANGKSVKVLVK